MTDTMNWREELRAFCEARSALPDMTSETAATLGELLALGQRFAPRPITTEELDAFIAEVLRINDEPNRS